MGEAAKKMTVPNQLKRILKERRSMKREPFTLEQLAELTGVSKSTLSRVQHGHVPETCNLKAILDSLGITAAEFFATDTDDKGLRLARALREMTPDQQEMVERLVVNAKA